MYPDHAFTPAIRARIVDGARGQAFLRREKFLIDERQVFAERESASQPALDVAQ